MDRGASVWHWRGAVAVLAGLVALAIPSSASASVTIGATFVSGFSSNCTRNFNWVQDSTQATSPSYVVPAGGGVITSWAHQLATGSIGVQLRLIVFEKTGPNSYLTVGHSNFETMANPGLNVFTTQVPVEGGELLGLRTGAPSPAQPGPACRVDSPGDRARSTVMSEPDPAIGDTAFLTSDVPSLLNIRATLEPDCDSDGFGDETQDPSHPCPRSLTLDANKNKVKNGKNVRLSGQVSETGQGGSCVANQPVELQRKKPKQTEFTTVEQLQTDAAGAFSTKEKVKKTFEYRVQAAETATCGSADSNTEKVKAKKPK
jgi:hypothetical protein